jgi:glyoxylase I family protein
MPAAIDFYHDTLGSKSPPPPNPETTTTGADLKLHGVEPMLNTAYEADQRPVAPDPPRPAAHNDTCLFSAAKILTPRTAISARMDSR